MWAVVGLSLVVLLVTYITHWITQWRNPKCNGVLPPGSMGWPLVGETLNAMTSSYSIDLHPFFKKRLEKYGPIFRTSLAGTPIVVSADPEFSSYLFQQGGKLVELGFFDSFTKIFKISGEINTAGSIIHKYIRSIALNHLGAETLKEKLLPLIEKTVVKTLASWSSQASVEVKHASSVMLLNFGAKHMIGYDAETSSDNLSDKFFRIMNSFFSFPLNVPGTAYHNSLKDRNKITTMLRDMLKKRRMSPDTHRGDFLDQISSDMDKEKFLSEDFAVYVVFGALFAGFEPISSIMALAFSLLAEHPAALQELTVVSETLRLANVAPALLRRALKDIPVKGFTIPAGWTIMSLTSALQLSPKTFKDPLKFNPWRWKVRFRGEEERGLVL
ncbi:hypothetical protein ACE6H2_027858 [Prunus campanulata]